MRVLFGFNKSIFRYTARLKDFFQPYFVISHNRVTPFLQIAHIKSQIHIDTRRRRLSRGGEEGLPSEILHQDQLWNCPQKQMADPVFTSRPFFLLRQGMVAGTTLPLFPASSYLPCPAIFQTRPWKTTDREAKSDNNISQNSCPVKGGDGKKSP